MDKWWWLLATIVMAMLMLLAKEALANDVVQFLCESEEAASIIAEKVVVSQEAADLIAMPFIDTKVCAYLPQAVQITIVYRGHTYGTGSFRVQVVGIGHKLGDKPDFFALMKLNEGAT